MLPRIHSVRCGVFSRNYGGYGESAIGSAFFSAARRVFFRGSERCHIARSARNGCTVITPNEIECCGNAGSRLRRMDLGRKSGSAQHPVFERCNAEFSHHGLRYLGSTLKEYGSLLAGTPDGRARRGFQSQGARYQRISCADPLRKPPKRIDAKVTYHDPCHLRRGQQFGRSEEALVSY